MKILMNETVDICGATYTPIAIVLKIMSNCIKF